MICSGRIFSALCAATRFSVISHTSSTL